MGGMFNCGQCGKDQHTDNVSYHLARKADGTDFEFGEPCYVDALAAHLNGDRPLAEVDGRDFTNHFVCPDCFEVYPIAQRVAYQDRCGWIVHCCVACRGSLPGPAYQEA